MGTPSGFRLQTRKELQIRFLTRDGETDRRGEDLGTPTTDGGLVPVWETFRGRGKSRRRPFIPKSQACCAKARRILNGWAPTWPTAQRSADLHFAQGNCLALKHKLGAPESMRGALSQPWDNAEGHGETGAPRSWATNLGRNGFFGRCRWHLASAGRAWQDATSRSNGLDSAGSRHIFSAVGVGRPRLPSRLEWVGPPGLGGGKVPES